MAEYACVFLHIAAPRIRSDSQARRWRRALRPGRPARPRGALRPGGLQRHRPASARGPRRKGYLARVRAARVRARRRVWELTGPPERLVLDIAGVLVAAHSEKEGAAGTYKGGSGFHPLLCFEAGSAEALPGYPCVPATPARTRRRTTSRSRPARWRNCPRAQSDPALSCAARRAEPPTPSWRRSVPPASPSLGLNADIRAWLEDWNENPRPFI